MVKKKKLYAGVGAKGTILTRFINPRVVFDDHAHRTTIKLISKEHKKINKKNQECLVFECLDGPASNTFGYSVKSHIIITEEGNRADFFLQTTSLRQKHEKKRKTLPSQQSNGAEVKQNNFCTKQ